MESVKDLIVDVNSTEVSIALMENNSLIELNKESSQGQSFSVGDVYLGKVKKLLPSLCVCVGIDSLDKLVECLKV